MENIMEALRIVAGSWPIAAIVIGTGITFTVRRTWKQSMQLAHEEKMDQLAGNRAVVVQASKRPHADD
jgi:hypothetical protein